MCEGEFLNRPSTCYQSSWGLLFWPSESPAAASGSSPTGGRAGGRRTGSGPSGPTWSRCSSEACRWRFSPASRRPPEWSCGCGGLHLPGTQQRVLRTLGTEPMNLATDGVWDNGPLSTDYEVILCSIVLDVLYLVTLQYFFLHNYVILFLGSQLLSFWANWMFVSLFCVFIYLSHHSVFLCQFASAVVIVLCVLFFLSHFSLSGAHLH